MIGTVNRQSDAENTAMTKPAPEPDWTFQMRDGMPSSSRWTYLDHAAVAPLPSISALAMRSWVDDIAENGATGWDAWRDRVESLRGLAAGLLTASVDEVAVIRNTTEGVCLVAEGYPWRRGDNVVVPGSEFPSNLFAWKHLESRGVEVRVVPTSLDHVSLDDLGSACDHNTRIVALSWIGYRTGFRIDLAAAADLAHQHGAWLFVDAIQGLGAFPLDVAALGIDALAADGHKWMLGPEGAGLFYLRSEHLDTLRPIGLGWNSVRHAGDFDNTSLDLKPSAARYEGGTYNMPGIAALEASLGWLTTFGIDAIQRRILQTTDDLCRRLASIGAPLASDRRPEHASGIVSFDIPGRDARTIRRACRDKNVVINCRDGRLRASPHAYTQLADLDRLIDALA
ncbi:MAG: aminotransferase [Planctomycetaceae bacterium]|nr:aminotransferase [Planctomycetaceae bacterium]